jgi:Domain of unknown function (DUF4417)/ParB-like nuclease domain
MAATIVEQSYEVVPVGKLKQHPKNPNKGNVGVIAESIEQNGFYGACVAQKSTGRILAGNHRWQGAKQAGAKTVPVIWLDVDDETALRIMLVDNRSSDLSTTDAELLAQVMKSLPSVVGTGYTQDDYDALMGAIEDNDVGQLDELISAPPRFSMPGDYDDDDADDNTAMPPGISEFEAGEDPEKDPTFDDTSSDLQGALSLKEDMDLRSKSNYYNIPDLRKDMLLEKLPEPFDTWAGMDATPDDGVTTWLYNYGVASFKGLPCDRAVLSFFTYDEKFAGWWEYPAFYTAKLMNAGIRMAVVPDFSPYEHESTARHIWNYYRAQWLGRYFQEAGLKVIPRLQIGDEKSLDFCMAGIPKNPPILIHSLQNNGRGEEGKEFEKQNVEYIDRALELLQPQTYVVYGGNPGKRIMESLKWDGGRKLWIENYVGKRRGVVFDKKEGLAANPEKKKAVAKQRREAKKAKANTEESVTQASTG